MTGNTSLHSKFLKAVAALAGAVFLLSFVPVCPLAASRADASALEAPRPVPLSSPPKVQDPAPRSKPLLPEQSGLLLKKERPRADIKKPHDNELLSGTTEIRGTATSQHFSHYTLTCAPQANPDNRTLIGDYDTPVENGKLADWDTTATPDGDYTLELTVYAQTGDTAQDSVNFGIDNDPPVVSISSPSDDSVVSSPFDVTGTATDAHLSRWRLLSESVSPLLLCHLDGNTTNERTGEEGQITGEPTYREGKYSQGIHITNSQGLTYPARGNLSRESGTIQMWVIPDWPGTDAETHVLLQTRTEDPSHPTDCLRLAKEQGGLSFTVYDAQGKPRSVSMPTDDETIPAGTPFHLAASWDSGNLSLSINGFQSTTMEGDGTGVLTDPGNRIYVGFYPNTGAEADATFDELAIYPYARSLPSIRTDVLSEIPKDMGQGRTLVAQGNEPVENSLLGTATTADKPGEAVTLTLKARDRAHGRAQIQETLLVDNASPVSEIASPPEGSETTGAVEIEGTAFDMDISSWDLSFKQGDPSGPGEWTPISSSEEAKWREVLGTWDTASLPAGAYVLRLRVTDASGKESSSLRAVTLRVTGPPAAEISQPTDGQAVSSPMEVRGTARSGALDRWELSYRELSPAFLCHYEGDTANERNEEEAEITGSPSYTPGKFGQGMHVGTDDTVSYRTEGNLSSDSGTIELFCTPDWSGSEPDPRVLFATEPPNPEQPSDAIVVAKVGGALFFYVFDSTGNPKIVYIPVDDAKIPAGVPFHLAATWNAGDMRLFLNGEEATEQAQGEGTGIISSLGAHFYPGSYAFPGISAQATVDELSVYTEERPAPAIIEDSLSTSQRSYSPDWQTVSSGTSPVEDSTLGTLVSAALPGEKAQVRLQVFETTGGTLEDTVQVVIDSPSPRAEITYPAEGQTVYYTVEIKGTATDVDLSSYTLSFKPGSDPNGPGDWTPIGEPHTQAVFKNTLGTWDTTSVPDGPCVLRLEVTDSGGKNSTAFRALTLQATGPPTAEISQPVDHSAAPSPIEVRGTARSGALDHWDLSYRELSPAFLCHYEGNTANERNAEEAEVTGSPSYAPGKFGVGIHVGSGDTVSYPTEGNLSKDAGTVELFCTPDWSGSDSSTHVLFSTEPVGGENRDTLVVGKDSGSIFFRIFDSSGSPKMVSIPVDDESIPAGVPFHLAAIWNTGDMRLFLNGEGSTDPAQGEGNGIISSLGAHFYVGSRFYPGMGAQGTIDELSIYNEARPAPSIREDSLSTSERTYAPDWRTFSSGTTPVEDSILGTMSTAALPGEKAQLRLQVFDRTGGTLEDTVLVMIDAPAPRAEITYPAEGQTVYQSVEIKGTAADVDLAGYTLSYKQGSDPNGPGEWTPIGEPHAQAVYKGKLGTWDTSSAPDGPCVLRLEVTDSGGRSASAFRLLEVDNRAPTAKITYPEEMGAVGETCEVRGSACGRNFTSYRLEFRSEQQPTAWIPIGEESAQPVEDGLLGTWDTSSLPEGPYLLRLTVRGLPGVEVVRMVHVYTDHTPPASEITSPGGTEALTGLIRIEGTADDSHFKEYGLEYAPQSDPSAWRPIAEHVTTPVSAGLLARWDTETLPDGAYTLRLTSTDTVGHSSTFEVSLELSNPGGYELSSLRTEPPGACLEVGEAALFTAIATDTDGHDHAVQPTWEVIGAIGTVDEGGLFTATALGYGSLRASCSGLTCESPISVVNKLRPQVLSSPMTLSASGNPWVLDGWVVAPQGVTLTLEPGVVVKVKQGGFYVEGSIEIGPGVVFTSFKDDGAMGDTNADGNASSPSPGDWSSVYLTGTSTSPPIRGAKFLYGGRETSEYAGGGRHVWSASEVWSNQPGISFLGCEFSRSAGYGAVTMNSSSTFEGNSFTDCAAGGTMAAAYPGAPGVSCTFRRNTTRNCLYGITAGRLSSVTAEENDLSGTQYGLGLSSCASADVRSNALGSSFSYGLSAADCGVLSVSDNGFSGAQYGLGLNNCATVSVNSNAFGPSNRMGLSAFDCGAVTVSGNGFAGARYGMNLSNCSTVDVNNNAFSSPEGYCLSAYRCDGVTVSGNNFSWSQYGLRLDNCGTVDISSNTLDSCSYGIYTAGSTQGVEAAGNTVSSCTYGIMMSEADARVGVRYNSLTASVSQGYSSSLTAQASPVYSFGIYLEAAGNCVIEGNSITGVTYGITVENPGDVVIRQNTVSYAGTETGTYGIAVRYGLPGNLAFVTGNTVSGFQIGVHISYYEEDYVEQTIVSGNTLTGPGDSTSSYGVVGNCGLPGHTCPGGRLYVNGNTISGFNLAMKTYNFPDVYVESNTVDTGAPSVYNWWFQIECSQGTGPGEAVTIRNNTVTGANTVAFTRAYGVNTFTGNNITVTPGRAVGVNLDASIHHDVYMGTCLVQGNTVSGGYAYIDASGFSYAYLEGNNFPDSQYPYLYALLCDADNSTIASNTLSGEVTGISSKSRTSSRIEGNTVNSSHAYINCEGSRGVEVRGNTLNGTVVNIRGSEEVAVRGNTLTGPHTAIYLNDSGGTVNGNVLSGGLGAGLSMHDFSGSVTNNRVTGFDTGVYASSYLREPPTLHDNEIMHNRSYGMIGSSNEVIDATDNWWGSSDGPAPWGGCNAVVGNVLVEPWIGQAVFYAGPNGPDPDCPFRGEPVNMNTGNFYQSHTDLSFETTGPPIEVTRTYNSVSSSRESPFGRGWESAYSSRVEPYIPEHVQGDMMLVGAEGQLKHYVNQGDGTYRPEDEDYTTLTHDPEGSWTLSREDSSSEGFDSSGRIVRITDCQGNTLTIDRDPDGKATSVTDACGQTAAFSYDAGGHITQVTDPAGRTVSYSYDERGNLTGVTDLNGGTTAYTYDTSHRMTTVTDPVGNTFARNTYDTFGRIVEQTDSQGHSVRFTYNLADRTSAFTDARGYTSAYTRDTQLRKISETDPLGHHDRITYDERGNVASRTDRRGCTTTYTYDESGNLTSETDPEGNTTAMTYDGRGNRTSTTDPMGATTTMTYDGANNLLTETDPLGNTTTYTYDGMGRQLTATDPMGRTTANAYDSRGNLVQTTNPDGGVTANAYDRMNRKTSTTDPVGNTATYAYDAIGHLVSMRDPAGGITTYAYDPDGNQVSATDPLGNTMGTAYDEMGRVSAEIDPLGGRKSYAYDGNGNKTAETDQTGGTTRHVYDASGREVETVDPGGNSTTRSYDNEGNVTAETDAEGNTTTSAYDPSGRLTSTTDPLGGTTTHAYDPCGREISTTDPLGHATTSAYDPCGRLSSTTDAGGNTTTFSYDGSGNKTAETDPEGHTTTSAYDSMNRLLTTTDPQGRTVSYTYDACGNRTSTTDGTGARTTFVYTPLGIISSATDPVGSTVSYDYDQAGRRVSMTDPKGAVTTYACDAAGRLTSEANPLGETTTYAYDAAGRVTEKTDGEGTTAYSYDANGNRIEASYPGGLTETAAYDGCNRPVSQSGGGVVISLSYDGCGRPVSASNGTAATTASYDAAGNITAKTLTCPGGEKSFSYSYDAANKMTGATQGSQTTAYSYSPSGRMTAKSYPNGIDASYGYDNSGALSSLVVNRGAQGVKAYQVSRDARANVTSVTEDGTRTTAYSYDASSRLTGENNPWMGNTTYSYDASGNRLSKDKDGQLTTYSYNPGDQLISDSSGKVYAYNSRGDLVRVENGAYRKDLSFDGKGRLTSITDTDGLSSSWTYDPLDRTYTSMENNQSIMHIYDMTSDIEAATLKQDLSLDTLFFSGADGLIASTKDNSTSYCSYNPHSDVSLVTDESGNTTDELHYDAWGNTAEETNEPYTYLGKHQRRAYKTPGLIKMGARFYDPDTGRFISRDPLKGTDELPISRNPYIYAFDDPVNMRDISGMGPMGDLYWAMGYALMQLGLYEHARQCFILAVVFDALESAGTMPTSHITTPRCEEGSPFQGGISRAFPQHAQDHPDAYSCRIKGTIFKHRVKFTLDVKIGPFPGRVFAFNDNWYQNSAKFTHLNDPHYKEEFAHWDLFVDNLLVSIVFTENMVWNNDSADPKNISNTTVAGWRFEEVISGFRQRPKLLSGFFHFDVLGPLGDQRRYIWDVW